MATTTLKTRIQHKYNTPTEWAENASFVPLKGEICVFNNGAGAKPEMKIGDGTTTLASLPFLKAGSDIQINSGSTNGTISVSIDGSAKDVAVKGLGARAFDSTSYLPSAGGTIYNSGTHHPLTIKSNKASESWIKFAANDDTVLGYLGALIDSNGTKSPMWYDSQNRIILHAGNYTNYTVTKTGSGASGTWGINITGYSIGLHRNDSDPKAHFTYTNANQNSYGWGQVMYDSSNKPCYVYYSTSKDAEAPSIRVYGPDGGTSAWVLTSANYTSYVPTKTGSGASGTWGINITGSSGSLSGSGGLIFTGDHFLQSVSRPNCKLHFGSDRLYDNDGSSYHILWRQGDSITGAVWNDYAEYRESDCVEFGRVLAENGDDTLSATTDRLQHFAGISSDTWGFCQGETEKAKTPIAVAGRVLAYPYRDRNEYKPGDCVCAAPNGTIDIMTREEVEHYPDRIVGTVSCVPEYEEWGQGDRPAVKVDGRIWIKIK